MVSSALALGLLALMYVLFRRFTRPSLSMIRGPKSPSFIMGNLLEIFQRQACEADFAWQSQYGNVVRFKTILGQERLLIADPKALQKILNMTAYSYSKLPSMRTISFFLNGRGLVWADGEDHRRQRSIMLPGFGPHVSKEYLPIFRDCAESISAKWLETIANNNGQSVAINILHWLSRGALDAIGLAAFDVQFGTVQDDSHPLARTYKSYLADVFGLPSAKQIFIQTAAKYIPKWIILWMVEHGSTQRLIRARDARITATRVAEELVREKANALLQGKGNRDIFTLLVNANMDASARKKLDDDELLAQMRTLLVAGHETTSTSLSFLFLELARNPNVQSRLRAEIRKMEVAIHARGELHFTSADLEAMPFLNAVIKEVLRFHPPATHALRVATQDGVLPLSKPLLTKLGSTIDEVFVPKGTEIMIGIAAYNRDKDIWGEDAHEFKPDRWLNGAMDDKKSPSVGVYSNLLTFLSGTRACLGWRFAVLEMQAFVAVLVGKFEFAMTDKTERIERRLTLIMAPMVDGELEKGVQMPLAVSLASQDTDV